MQGSAGGTAGGWILSVDGRKGRLELNAATCTLVYFFKGLVVVQAGSVCSLCVAWKDNERTVRSLLVINNLHSVLRTHLQSYTGIIKSVTVGKKGTRGKGGHTAGGRWAVGVSLPPVL